MEKAYLGIKDDLLMVNLAQESGIRKSKLFCW